MINKKVIHKQYGKGKIINFTKGRYITVQFPSKTCQFVYPDAFKEFLTAEDIEFHRQALDEIEDEKGMV